MVKSSEVLRLAAEYALKASSTAPVLSWACDEYGLRSHSEDWFCIVQYADMCGYEDAVGKETCMALCLAAAIAEDEGD